MNPKATKIIEQLQDVYDRLQRQLVIVETGTIRNIEPDYEVGDGHSTYFIAKWNNDRHKFISIDIKTDVAKKYLENYKLIDRVKLRKGNSIDILPQFGHIDFCYLDSANDAENTLQEFLIAWPKITDGGCLMVDDCNEDSNELHKGDLLMPYLRDNNILFIHENNQLILNKWKQEN